jgi:hypothetical protein
MKYWATFFLVALVGGAAPIVQVQLTNAGNPSVIANNVTIGSTSYSGVYIGPYTMLINGQTTPALCIDFSDESYLNTSFNADVTPVESSDLSNTYYKNGTEYKEEAYLFSQIVKPGSDRTDLQEAAWEITSYNIVDASYKSLYGDNTYINAALCNYASMNLSGYEIISDTVQHGEQEFLIDPTPEPGSALLLGVGLLAGAGAIRYRRSRGVSALSSVQE